MMIVETREKRVPFDDGLKRDDRFVDICCRINALISLGSIVVASLIAGDRTVLVC